jgi:hypothetical protein
VGNLEKKFKDVLGVKVQIENKAGELADNKVTLGSLLGGKQTPSKNTPKAEPKKGCLGMFLFLGGIGVLAAYLIF